MSSFQTYFPPRTVVFVVLIFTVLGGTVPTDAAVTATIQYYSSSTLCAGRPSFTSDYDVGCHDGSFDSVIAGYSGNIADSFHMSCESGSYKAFKVERWTGTCLKGARGRRSSGLTDVCVTDGTHSYMVTCHGMSIELLVGIIAIGIFVVAIACIAVRLARAQQRRRILRRQQAIQRYAQQKQTPQMQQPVHYQSPIRYQPMQYEAYIPMVHGAPAVIKQPPLAQPMAGNSGPSDVYHQMDDGLAPPVGGGHDLLPPPPSYREATGFASAPVCDDSLPQFRRDNVLTFEQAADVRHRHAYLFRVLLFQAAEFALASLMVEAFSRSKHLVTFVSDHYAGMFVLLACAYVVALTLMRIVKTFQSDEAQFASCVFTSCVYAIINGTLSITGTGADIGEASATADPRQYRRYHTFLQTNLLLSGIFLLPAVVIGMHILLWPSTHTSYRGITVFRASGVSAVGLGLGYAIAVSLVTGDTSDTYFPWFWAVPGPMFIFVWWDLSVMTKQFGWQGVLDSIIDLHLDFFFWIASLFVAMCCLVFTRGECLDCDVDEVAQAGHSVRGKRRAEL